MIISDLRGNVGLLQQSAGHDLSKSNKNTRGNSSKEGPDFEDQDYDAERTDKSLDTPIIDQGSNTAKNVDSDQASEANFEHHRHKKCKTVIADTSRAPLRDSFFNDITSYSDMPNVEDVTCSSLCIAPCETHHNQFFYFNCLTFLLLFFFV